VPTKVEIEREIERMLNSVARLNDAELVMLRARWEADDPERREIAWGMAKAAIRRTKREGILEAARTTIVEWLNDFRPAPFNRFMGSSLVGIDSVSVGNTNSRAVPPVLDAVVALVAADGLGESDRRVLMDPVEHVTSRHVRSDV
jgi:hypothetical protein